MDGYKASIKADEAAIESARTQLDYTTIVAPIDGRAGIRQIDLGRIIHASDQTPLVIITQTQPAAVIFTLPQIQLDRCAMRWRAVRSKSGARTRTTSRRLLPASCSIDALIDQTTDHPPEGVVPQHQRKVVARRIRQCTGAADPREQRRRIPSTALQRGPRGVFAWVIGGDGKAQMRPIETSADEVDESCRWS